jgi:hypothetical protein
MSLKDLRSFKNFVSLFYGKLKQIKHETTIHQRRMGSGN